MFHIRNLWLIQAWRLRKTKAESVQTTGLFVVVDFAQTVCTLLKKHMAGRVGKTQIQGGGDQRGSKQMHHGSGHLCLYRGREIHFLLLLVLHQFHWQFLPDVPMYPRSVWEASTGLMETYNQAHICPSYHLFCCCFFSRRATFSSFWQWKRKCCTEFPCTVHSDKVCVFYEWPVFGLFLPVHNARRSFPHPSSLVVEGGKEALSRWWALL